MLLSFVIPCYGSETTIEHVITEIINKVSERPNCDYEIITVNDASPDDVITVLRKLAKTNTKIKVIDLAKNFGKHSALMAGFSCVKGDVIVSIDDDGQCPMEKLWEMVDPILKEKYDVTLAAYYKKKQSKFKNFGSGINSLMSRALLGKPKDLEFANYYAIKRFVIDEIVKYRNPYPYMEGLILRSTRRIKNVFMNEHERIDGVGNFNFSKSLSLWLNGFTAFSVKPLRVASILGATCAVAGFIYGIIVIIQKLVFNDILVLGYSSILSAILLIGGLMMLMLGLIGEYIGRIYISINNSPQYVIRETINYGEEDDT